MAPRSSSGKKKARDSTALIPSKWPECCPFPEEHAFLSISIGNTSIKWAVHNGAHDNYSARTAWKTTHLGEEDFKENNPFLILSRYLSNAGLKLVFGESMQASKEKADEAARLRPVHLLTVYFTTNEFDQLAMIASLWKDIPCRLIQLQPNDFFTEEQGRYDTMGIDRLATLRCAGSTFGFPVLVIDGGTCLTHTSADENGKIIGGGISFGYGAQLHSIVNRIDSVALDTNVLMKEANAMLAKCQELDPFPQNTVHAVLTDVMGGISTNLRRVIKQYVKRVGSPEGMEDDGITPKARHVVIVGGDEATISDLLNPRAPYFESDETMPNYHVHTMKHAIALGVSFVLHNIVEETRNKNNSKHGELMRLLMGKRVAKHFADGKGGMDVFRGTIMAVSDEVDDAFFAMVRYDDDDVEELQPPDLFTALKLYVKVGEISVGKPSEDLMESSSKKKKGAEDASAVVLASFPAVQAQADKLHKAAVAAATGPTVKPAPTPTVKRKAPTEVATPVSSAKKKKVPEKPDPLSFKGRRAAKLFDNVVFYGTIDNFTAESDGEDEFWHVTYDDGDDEEYDSTDLKIALKFYEKVKADDPKGK